MKIAVISGGFSEEQGSSRESGICVANALVALGHDVVTIEYDMDFMNNLYDAKPDVAFPLVQGKRHGDGSIQALLEFAGLPYVGSRFQYAAVINHKTVCKRIWRSAGILTPDFFEFSRAEYEQYGYGGFLRKAAGNNIPLPIVVKPPTQGNRFGMVFVKDEDSFAGLEDAFAYDEVLLAEQYVPGRFFTQGIAEIDGETVALPPVEVIDDSADEVKRFPGGSAFRAHGLTAAQLRKMSRITLEASALTGASAPARLDYHLCGTKMYLLEINAVPGLVPGYGTMAACWETAGYGYNDFIQLLLNSAK